MPPAPLPGLVGAPLRPRGRRTWSRGAMERQGPARGSRHAPGARSPPALPQPAAGSFQLGRGCAGCTSPTLLALACPLPPSPTAPTPRGQDSVCQTRPGARRVRRCSWQHRAARGLGPASSPLPAVLAPAAADGPPGLILPSTHPRAAGPSPGAAAGRGSHRAPLRPHRAAPRAAGLPLRGLLPTPRGARALSRGATVGPTPPTPSPALSRHLQAPVRAQAAEPFCPHPQGPRWGHGPGALGDPAPGAGLAGLPAGGPSVPVPTGRGGAAAAIPATGGFAQDAPQPRSRGGVRAFAARWDVITGTCFLPGRVYRLCRSRTARGERGAVTASGGRNGGAEAAPGCGAGVRPGPGGQGRGAVGGTAPGNPRGPRAPRPRRLAGAGGASPEDLAAPSGGCSGPPEPRAPPSRSLGGRCGPAAPAAPPAPSTPASRVGARERGGAEEPAAGTSADAPAAPGAAAGDAGPRGQRRAVRSAEHLGPAAPGGAGGTGPRPPRAGGRSGAVGSGSSPAVPPPAPVPPPEPPQPPPPRLRQKFSPERPSAPVPVPVPASTEMRPGAAASPAPTGTGKRGEEGGERPSPRSRGPPAGGMRIPGAAA